MSNRIINTSSSGSSYYLRTELSNLGLEVVDAPLIRTSKITLEKEEIEYLQNHCFDYLLFTSKNGVGSFFETLAENKLSISDSTKFICISEKTAESLKKHHHTASIIGNKGNAKALIEELKAHSIENKTILACLGNLAPNLLINFLKTSNQVKRINFYETEEIDLFDSSTKELILKKEYKLILVNSPSAVRSFHHNIETVKAHSFICIGPTTKAELQRLGKKNALMAEHPKDKDLIDKIKKHLLEKI